MSNLQLYHGDCLELLPEIPTGSVDLILCDPPYGTIKNAALKGWDASTTQWDDKINTAAMFEEYERILRENGTAVIFSQEPYTSELRNHKTQNLEFAYPLIWKKDHFANPLCAKKAPVSYFEDISVYYKKYDRQLINPLRAYFSKVMDFIGISSCKKINKIMGHRRAEHCFYVDTMQFSLCTAKTYQELIDIFRIDKMAGFKTFAECEQIAASFDRTFNLPTGQNYVGNVLEFKKERQGLHPTQKPVAMLEHIIKIYTNPGDTVLDNCMGSGSTGVACIKTDREFIGMEKSPHIFRTAKERIEKEAVAPEQMMLSI